MKYMVMVNNKYMTQVEVEGSACAAEHVILDDLRYGIVSALAFDAEAMKTEHFNACFQSCDLVTIDQLRRKCKSVQVQIDIAISEAQRKQDEITAQIEALKAKQRDLGYEINRLRGSVGEEI